MTQREQSWSDRPPPEGRVALVSRNPVSTAIAAIAAVLDRPVTLIEEDEGGAGVRAFEAFDPTESDAVVLCDHDAPDAPAILRGALSSSAGYVAMMASRRRSEGLLADLRAEGYDDTTLARLHVPAGLDTGGKSPGEIALSVVSEIVATSYGRSGGPMRDR
jgi:xanthine/CO dehydrogenase XdhC/CoxF family maturation factor